MLRCTCSSRIRTDAFFQSYISALLKIPTCVVSTQSGVSPGKRSTPLPRHLTGDHACPHFDSYCPTRRGRSLPSLATTSLVERLRVRDGHGVQHLIQQLQSAVEVDLDPAGRLLDALPRVVRPPALDEAHAQDAKPAQVVHADARRRRQTCGGRTRVRNMNKMGARRDNMIILTTIL